MRPPHRQHASHPVQQRMGIARLCFDVDGLVAVERVHDGGQRQRGRLCAREAAIAVGRPLHGRAHAVAVTEADIVAHADLIAVVDHRRAGHREQQAVHQLDAPSVALQQRRQAAADAEIDARAAVGGVGLPEIIPLGIGHHLERQLVVVAQEDRPLAGVGDLRRLAHDVGDGKAVLARQRHVHARHQREMEGHVALVALAEIVLGVLGPLVGFGEQHAIGVELVELGTDPLQHGVRLGQVLVVGAFALDQIGNGIEPEPVDPEIEPEAHDAQHRLDHLGIVEIEVGLVRIEAVPVVGFGDRIPRPVGTLGVDEDDARALVFLVGVRPDVEIPRHRAGFGAARTLEPGMLIRGVIDHQLGHDAQAALVGGGDESLHVGELAVFGMDGAVVADVVAVVDPRRGIEGQQPQRVDAEIGDVVELGDQAGKVADAVIVGIEERLHMQLVDDRILVPERIRGRDHGAGELRRRRVHAAAPRSGDRRQMANGRTAGSSRSHWRLPCSVKRRPVIRSSASRAALSGRFHSHSGISKLVSCGW